MPPGKIGSPTAPSTTYATTVINVSFGDSTNAVTSSAIVSAVTRPGVIGSGNEMNADTMQNARHTAIFVISRTVKPAFDSERTICIKNPFLTMISPLL